jgi:hypothetical protein
MKNYFYSLLHKYLALYVLPQNTVVEVDPVDSSLIKLLKNSKFTFSSQYEGKKEAVKYSNSYQVDFDKIGVDDFDYILLSWPIHSCRDIQKLLAHISSNIQSNQRLILIYYSLLWGPFFKLATWLGLRKKTNEQNWLAHEDVVNLLRLENFELIKQDSKVLIPIYIPLISNFINSYVAPLPLIKHLCMVNIAIARPIPKLIQGAPKPSVTVVIPARNEAGNMAAIISRTPKMGPHDELIFIEGGSKDDTWQVIQDLVKKNINHLERKILAAQQVGKGKGDAVRLGYQMASNPILMILDADMTVPPEDLPKFYEAIITGKGDFINGSRLVYPMEKRAMRFFNLLGNKFFAAAFSFVLGQRFKDTLCGTKVIKREDYLKLAKNRSYFGDFDPFGDFDLIFGAARMGLKIVEVPIVYRERTYGETNISRWRHGIILLSMLLFASRKIKFL